MAMVVDEESEQQRMETEAKAKEAADAAAREPLPPPPPPFLTQRDFAQYMRMADERQQMLIESQSKMMQDVMDRNRE
jgi:hypothetical protein